MIRHLRIALLATGMLALQLAQALPPINDNKVDCVNFKTDFSRSTDGWIADNSIQDTYEISDRGIEMKLMPPTRYIRMHDSFHNLPYNQFEGRGPTFNASTYMRFGRVSATIQSASVGGAITAVILIADNGDEIDFEFLGGDPDHVQTNYFWGREVLYTVNGGYHDVPGGAVYDNLHTYTIDWSPERIEWYVDGQLVRTREKKDTCDENGVCKFPSEPARVQIGLWDGSIDSGTAQWSRGPIDWQQHNTISAFLKSVESECNPEYNNVIA
ncbi:concanavalin A-like lectin/glucanase domain-containing protein [Dichotomocladium elegans]|nr:concanavalin A-like lectin/glucanase domain-containing protein [Dichotomocladium elegans]